MKTCLDFVNEVLKKAKVINGDSGVLTTLTDSARQLYIDNAVQAINEGMDQLYNITGMQPNVMGTDTITLTTSTRTYSLNSALNKLHFPLIDTTNGNYIYEYEGGYQKLFESQPLPSSYTSLPQYAVIRPSDGLLYIDTSPDSTYNGRVYTYNYEKDISISAAADTVPFSDVVFRSMVPAVTEIWKRNQHREFDGGMINVSLSRAASYLMKKSSSDTWNPRHPEYLDTDPLNG